MVFNPFPDNLAILWDLIAAVISFICVLLLVETNGRIQKSGKVSTIITRKVVHIFAAPIYVVTWLLFSGSIFTRFIALIVPLIFCVQFILIGTGRIEDEEFVGSMSRSGDPSELLQGTLYYAITMIIITVFWFYIPFSGNIANANPTAFIVLGSLAGGDGLADIIGRKYGGNKKLGIAGSEKTLFGSLAMFTGSFLVSFLLLLIFSFEIPSFNPIFLIPALLIISFIATLAELLSPKGTDNIFIPISVIIMILLFSIFLPALWPFNFLGF
ncbi:MAG: conserved membrane protein of unknown function [Promethearchaeota archaeon]|nr:MAG: conserved membrane protein of unknown function [Candidatus Lokiarchaeota archaeon]